MTNEALDCLKTRRSVRKYKEDPIEQEKLDAIMEAATYAPTGAGTQSPKIVLIKNPEMVRKIGKMNGNVAGMGMDAFYGAPCVAIVFANKAGSPTWFEDACLVAGNLLNAAHAVGVDSCYIYRAKDVFETEEGKALKAEWGLDDNYVGVANCILGYGAGAYPEPVARKADYVVTVE